jgi:hypothetical protein
MDTKNQERRFRLDKQGYIIDNLNLGNSGKYEYAGRNDSDIEFRRHILWIRLDDLVPKLIVGPNARKLRDSLVKLLLAVIEASQLNTLDPLISIQHPFKGKLRRKEGMRDYTSISLFVRDVERVLRDLYGDLERTELDTVLSAISEIVVEVMGFVRPDLAAEYEDAQTIDYRCLPTSMRYEGEGVSSDEAGAAALAAMVLAVRALQVKSNPSRHCRYTIKFVEALDKFWPKLGGIDRVPRTVPRTERVYYEI